MPSRLLVLTVFIVSSIIGAGEAPDGPIASPEKGWPQFRGPRRDGISDETGLLTTWPADGPKLVWKAADLGRGWSSPIISGDSIFLTGDVAGEVQIFCLDLKGAVKWKTANGAGWLNPYPGARASCAISDGVLYHMNATGRLLALDAATGKELWNANILKRFESQNIIWGISESLLIDGPRVIVTPGGPKALMAALDKKTGETVWTSEPIAGDKAAYASPVLFQMRNRRLIAGCSSKHGFGVDADTGKLLWSVPVANPYGATCCNPVFGDGAVFYAVPDGPAGAQYRLSTTAEGVNAEQSWKTIVEPLTGGGIFKDGVLYASGCKKSKALHALDWKTGTSRYETRLSLPSASHATSAMIWADGRLYCLFENGLAALIRPTENAFEIAGKFQLADASKPQDAWAHPVLLDGRLYLRYHATLWCFDVKQP